MRRRQTSRSRTLFVDAGAYFALLDEDDEHHSQAVAIYDQLVAQRWQLLTSSFILAETHALLLNRLNQQIATRFLRDMQESSNSIIWVTPADVEQAKQIIYQYDDKEFTLTDATSFVLMERLKIPYSFTFDRHFAQYGLNVLSPDFLSQR